jgi:hypothetical protein
MGFIKFIIILLINLTIVVIGIRFVSLILDRLGVFGFMERLFGRRNDYQVREQNTEEKIYADEVKQDDDDI